VQRFARYWDLIANSGRFQHSLPLLLFRQGQITCEQAQHADAIHSDGPFSRFMKLSDWLYEKTAQTHKIAYNRLLALVLEGSIATELADEKRMHQSLAADCQANGDAHPPRWLRAQMPAETTASSTDTAKSTTGSPTSATPSRQSRHLTSNSMPD